MLNLLEIHNDLTARITNPTFYCSSRVEPDGIFLRIGEKEKRDYCADIAVLVEPEGRVELVLFLSSSKTVALNEVARMVNEVTSRYGLALSVKFEGTNWVKEPEVQVVETKNLAVV